MKDTLITMLATSSIPPDQTITYDNMHGLWGGTTIIVRGDGRIATATTMRGSQPAPICHASIPPLRLLDLIRLLIHHAAWEQRIPDRPPAPDESRATLTIIWEWVNDLAPTNRLSQIKTWLEQAFIVEPAP